MEITGGTALTRRSVNSGWTITSFVSNSNILRSLMPYSLGLLMSLACLLLMMLIVLSTSLGKMLRPVVSLAKTMDGAAKATSSRRSKFAATTRSVFCSSLITKWSTICAAAST